jgi:hypothetical protein
VGLYGVEDVRIGVLEGSVVRKGLVFTQGLRYMF